MTIQRTVFAWGSAIALATGLAATLTPQVSACPFSSINSQDLGSILSFKQFSSKFTPDALWQLGILASGATILGAGLALDQRRQRRATITQDSGSNEMDFEPTPFVIPIPPEALISAKSEVTIVPHNNR